MKNLLFTILLMIPVFICAQSEYILDGTISDGEGNPVPFLELELVVYGPDSLMYYESTDSSGYYNFQISDLEDEGCLEFGFWDCDNDLKGSVACWYEQGMHSLTTDWIYCSDTICNVFIYEVFVDITETFLATELIGNAPFTYEWSDGSNDPVLYVFDDGVYCVTVTDANGCESNECYDYISQSGCQSFIYEEYGWNEVSLFAESLGVPPFNYTWSNGAIEETITVFQSGDYCLTIVDDAGCEDINCIYVEIPIDSSCWNWIVQSWEDSTGFTQLSVEAFGLAPFTYQWSNGATTDTIILDFADTDVCVTVTDANDCVSESCVYIYGDCGVEISCDPVPGGVFLFSNAWGEWPISYIWSTGDTTESIEIDEAAEYCVTITDANDCSSDFCFFADPADNPFDTTCFIFIYEEFDDSLTYLSFESFGTEAIDFIWSDGSNDPRLLVTEEGEYCVEVTFEDDCIADACYYYLPPESCGSWITEVYNSDFTSTLIADAWGEGPFTYQWDDGQFGEEIIVSESRTYCVEVVDALGCLSGACYYYDAIQSSDSCWTYIDVFYEDTLELATLTAESFSEPDFYQWSTGEIMQSIIVEESGEYCVTITDIFGCESYNCTFVDFTLDQSSSQIGSIIGYVFDNFNLFTGEVVLYKETGGEYEEAQRTDITHDLGFSFYQFSNVPEGDYIIQALSDEAQYMPTYYQSTLLWEEAEMIYFGEGDFAQIDVFLIPSSGVNGPGMITGSVIEGEGLVSGDTPSKGPDDPMEDITILLLSDDNLALKYMDTDSDGKFSFDGLPYGTYKVLIEEAGEEHSTRWVTLSPEAPTGNVGFLFEKGSFISNVEDIEIASMHILPNPASDKVIVSFETKYSSNINISIYNIIGQEVLQTKNETSVGKNEIDLNISELASGKYFMKLYDESGSSTKTFIKI